MRPQGHTDQRKGGETGVSTECHTVVNRGTRRVCACDRRIKLTQHSLSKHVQTVAVGRERPGQWSWNGRASREFCRVMLPTGLRTESRVIMAFWECVDGDGPSPQTESKSQAVERHAGDLSRCEFYNNVPGEHGHHASPRSIWE